jgi:cell division protein FtsL
MRVAIAYLLTVAVLMLGIGIIHVHRRHTAVRLGYDLTKASDELRSIREENRKLRLEKSTLTTPARIQHLAEILGMRQPTHSQVRVVPLHKKVTRR